MGSGNSSKKRSMTKLRANEVQEYIQATTFSEELVLHLHTHFQYISSSKIEDGVIDYEEFCQMLDIDQQSIASKQIFKIFDVNGDGVINFREFLIGINTLMSSYITQNILKNKEGTQSPNKKIQSRALKSLNGLHEQASLVFRIMDIQQNGYITQEDLSEILSASLAQAKLQLDQNLINDLVQNTFKK